MSVTDDMLRAVKYANRRFPLRKVKSCWTCAFAIGEFVREEKVHVRCERRYEGLNDEVVKYSDVVLFDEVCPLWEERTGEMAVRHLVGGAESEVKG